METNATLWVIYTPSGSIMPMYSTNLGTVSIEWISIPGFSDALENGTNILTFTSPGTDAQALFFQVWQTDGTTEIQSINTVGMHKYTISPGELILVSPTVDNQRGNTLEDILGDQLPVNSAVFKWDGMGYIFSYRSVWTGWTPNYTVLRGQVVFVQESASALGSVTFSFTGEVPETLNGGGTTGVSLAEIDATAYPYPVDIEFGETQAAIAAEASSAVFFWNHENQSYDPAVPKTPFGGWADAESRVIHIGEAFFMDTASPISVDEVVPYDLNL